MRTSRSTFPPGQNDYRPGWQACPASKFGAFMLKVSWKILTPEKSRPRPST